MSSFSTGLVRDRLCLLGTYVHSDLPAGVETWALDVIADHSIEVDCCMRLGAGCSQPNLHLQIN